MSERTTTGRYYECRDCHNQLSPVAYRAQCPNCDGELKPIVVATE